MASGDIRCSLRSLTRWQPLVAQEEAMQTCRSIPADESASATHRREAEQRIGQLKQDGR